MEEEGGETGVEVVELEVALELLAFRSSLIRRASATPVAKVKVERSWNRCEDLIRA